MAAYRITLVVEVPNPDRVLPVSMPNEGPVTILDSLVDALLLEARPIALGHGGYVVTHTVQAEA